MRVIQLPAEGLAATRYGARPGSVHLIRPDAVVAQQRRPEARQDQLSDGHVVTKREPEVEGDDVQVLGDRWRAMHRAQVAGVALDQRRRDQRLMQQAGDGHLALEPMQPAAGQAELEDPDLAGLGMAGQSHLVALGARQRRLQLPVLAPRHRIARLQPAVLGQVFDHPA